VASFEQPETTTPSEHSFNWRDFIFWPLVIVFLYVLSWAPVLRMQKEAFWNQHPLGANGVEILRMSQKTPHWNTDFVRGLYEPLRWTHLNTPLHKPLGMYLHLWLPDEFDKDGEGIESF
jgi:hypothetical protein